MMSKKRAVIKKDFSASQVGTLLESVDKKIDVLVDGHGVLSGKVDRLEKKVDEGFASVHSEMDYKFGVVFDELHLIRTELKQKVDRDEFVVLEKRVMALEKQISGRKT